MADRRADPFVEAGVGIPYSRAIRHLARLAGGLQRIVPDLLVQSCFDRRCLRKSHARGHEIKRSLYFPMLIWTSGGVVEALAHSVLRWFGWVESTETYCKYKSRDA